MSVSKREYKEIRCSFKFAAKSLPFEMDICRYEWSAQRLKWALVSYVCSNQNIDQNKQMERVRGMIEKEYNRDREREGVIR